MKKILIYSETMLYLKGIDLLINEGIQDIKTKCANSFSAFQELISKESHAMIILHINFLGKQNKHLENITSVLPPKIPVLILTDNIVNVGKLFPVANDLICLLDVRNTDTKIISMANKLLGISSSNNTTT
ncbi:MAG: hypothetical protein U1C70_08465 [Sediminibacterium sp.]|jgi:hypothetical protein|uniref:hypothetical protein n=1 Tax=Sediminibacterium sp. TaxID=1917865 RepID=UPI002ABC73D9|nr:hypothetical protein [Sediminibacterium sp.]MDZ4071842.1 hypothetical protein [Sediminibacterium sp.]